MFHTLNRKIIFYLLEQTLAKTLHFRTGQNTASLTHTLKLEMLDMVNVKKEYAAFPGPVPTHRQQYFEGHMIP